jgi:hypothetical protein
LDPERSPVAARERFPREDELREEGVRRQPRGALARLTDDPSSRKRFLRMLGGGAGAAALAGLGSACGPQPPVGITQKKPGEVGNFGPGDGGIVNFALLVEHIEGDFYDRVVRERVGSSRVRAVFRQVRQNESEHRDALERITDQIGRQIRPPRTNFDRVFAGGDRSIVAFAGVLENLGAAAYLGQAPYIVDREVLQAALRIHTVEARQAAALNELAGRGFQGGGRLEGSIPDGAFARPMTQRDVLRRIEPYLVGGLPSLRPPVA